MRGRRSRPKDEWYDGSKDSAVGADGKVYMRKIGRNDPCPCGSGKKFKKCHLGREDELFQKEDGAFAADLSARITALPEVDYGDAHEMVRALDLQTLSRGEFGIRFVDLKAYQELEVNGETGSESRQDATGGVLINLLKTRPSDPAHMYIAISPDIGKSALAHQIAHVLDYAVGSGLIPGSMRALSYELGIPIDQLEHPQEFGYWLRYVREKLGIELDADDTVIDFLYENRMLVKGRDIEKQDMAALKDQSQRIFKFLSQKGPELDALICEKPGYIGSRLAAD